jgi:uncharacterized repeat protein (TIGR01451 family)
MRAKNHPFEQINEEQLVKRIYNFVSPVDGVSPTDVVIQLVSGDTEVFTVTPMDPLTHSLDVAWYVDDAFAGSGLQLNLDSQGYAVGSSHTVEVVVSDSTGKVRYDPAQVLEHQHAWTVIIVSGGNSDLVVAAYDSPDPVFLAGGGNLLYSASVTNTGPDAAEPVHFTHTLPAGVSVLSINGEGVCVDSGGNTYVCDYASMASGETQWMEFQTQALEEGTLSYTASAVSGRFDPDLSNNSSSQETTAIGFADLSVMVSDSPDPTIVGVNVRLTVTVSNSGPDTARDAQVTITLPGNATVSFISSNPPIPCSQTDNTLVCDAGDIAATMTQDVSFFLQPQQIGAYDTTGAVSTVSTDTVPGNDTATATTTVTEPADLSVTVDAGPDPVALGGSVWMDGFVTNNGTATATGVQFTHGFLPYTAVVLDSQGSVPCTPSGSEFVCDIGDMPSGQTHSFHMLVKPQETGTLLYGSSSSSSGTGDPDTGNNEALQEITVTADLVVAPTNLVASETTQGAQYYHELAWDAVPGATQYQVYEGPGISGPWTAKGDTETTNSARYRVGKSSTLRCYVVTASNGTNPESAYSKWACSDGTTQCIPEPAQYWFGSGESACPFGYHNKYVGSGPNKQRYAYCDLGAADYFNYRPHGGSWDCAQPADCPPGYDPYGPGGPGNGPLARWVRRRADTMYHWYMYACEE